MDLCCGPDNLVAAMWQNNLADYDSRLPCIADVASTVLAVHHTCDALPMHAMLIHAWLLLFAARCISLNACLGAMSQIHVS